MMDQGNRTSCTAFEGTRRIGSGEVAEVALKTKEVVDRAGHESVLIFDDVTCEPIEIDFRGTAEDVVKRLARRMIEGEPVTAPSQPDRGPSRGPGRPKLGVVAREVTLLPRHWDWLNDQPGGASVALRKLVEEARRANESKDRARRSQEAAYRFMSTMAGNLTGFEEATRALFAGDRERFEGQIQPWPADIREHARKLAEVTFPGTVGP